MTEKSRIEIQIFEFEPNLFAQKLGFGFVWLYFAALTKDKKFPAEARKTFR